MGQKVNPTGLRVGVINTWLSRWYATKDFARYLGEDMKIRKFVKSRLQGSGVARVEIERAATRVKILIHTAKPGLVIGKKGKDIDDLKKELRDLVKRDAAVNIIEVRKPDTDGALVAENVAFQLEKRISFRRAMKEAVSRALRMGAEGMKIQVSGRLNGAEIARCEKFREGRVPLHTLRADIDYGFAEAHTPYGRIGVKVWIFKGEKFTSEEEMPAEALQL